MAEYQFYEFRTVNRTLTAAEVKEVNTWSSRFLLRFAQNEEFVLQKFLKRLGELQ